MRLKLFLAAALAAVAFRVASPGPTAPAFASEALPRFSKGEAGEAVPEGRLIAVGDVILTDVTSTHGMEAVAVSGAVAASVAAGTPVQAFLAAGPDLARP